jgi:hypothetical protein
MCKQFHQQTTTQHVKIYLLKVQTLSMMFFTIRGKHFLNLNSCLCYFIYFFYCYNSERKFSSSSSNEGSASAHARRHSVGTFNSRNDNKMCTTSFIDEAPQGFAPRAPTDLHNWRRTSRGEFTFHIHK